MEEKQEGRTDKVTIIIPVRNNLEFTRQCLDSIVANTLHKNIEVIIVNNGSTDDTKEYLDNFKLPLKGRVITNSDNKSYSVTNNQARRLIKDDEGFVVLLNNDVIVTKGWLTQMLDTYYEYEDVGIIGCKLVFPGTGGIQHAGVFFMHHGVPDHLHINCDNEDDIVNRRLEVPAVTAACVLIPISVYDEMGGLDERYRFGYEDIAICNKMREAGYKVIYEPKAVVYHYGSMTPGRYESESDNFNIYARDWILNGKYLNIKVKPI